MSIDIEPMADKAWKPVWEVVEKDCKNCGAMLLTHNIMELRSCLTSEKLLPSIVEAEKLKSILQSLATGEET